MNFRAAISQWQLAARTDVKRASSLPSSMFDECDPMLEARLAESVEAMMHCLHQPEATALAKINANEDAEIRTEKVEIDELRKLPTMVPREPVQLDLESGISAEYLSLLIDTCTTGDESSQAAARDLLEQDFAIAANQDLETATQVLAACLNELEFVDQHNDETQRRLTELCGAIAASVILESDSERDRP